MPGLVKVGYSTKDPSLRARELDSSGFPHSFRVEADFLVDSPRDVEQRAHSQLSSYREAKEWFRCDVAIAASAIQHCAAKIYLSSGTELRRSEKVDITTTARTAHTAAPPIVLCKRCGTILYVKPWRELYCWKCMGLDSTLALIARDKAWCDTNSAKVRYVPESQNPSDPRFNANRKRGDMGWCEGCGKPVRVVSDGVAESCTFCATGELSEYQRWAKTPMK